MKQNVFYSVGTTTVMVGPDAGKELYRPYLQISGVLSLDDIAEHMSEHNNKYDEGDINAVIRQFIKCVCEMVSCGYKVNLGKLGTFRPGIKVKCEEDASAVTSDNITDLLRAWSAGKKTKHLRDNATFNLVGKRANQKLLVSAEKNGQTSMTLTQTSVPNKPDNPGTGGDNGGVSGE